MVKKIKPSMVVVSKDVEFWTRVVNVTKQKVKESKEDVKFHDGSDWNATVAKWNIDRVHLINGNYTEAMYWFDSCGRTEGIAEDCTTFCTGSTRFDFDQVDLTYCSDSPGCYDSDDNDLGLGFVVSMDFMGRFKEYSDYCNKE